MDNKERFSIVSQKQALNDQLEVHEQAILGLAEMVGTKSSFLSFKVHPSVIHQLDELGELEEYIKEPEKPFHSVHKVVVSEEDDPYNDVPLRFEDLPSDALHTEVRIDENSKHIEYEPESKPESMGQTNKPALPMKPRLPRHNVPTNPESVQTNKPTLSAKTLLPHPPVSPNPQTNKPTLPAKPPLPHPPVPPKPKKRHGSLPKLPPKPRLNNDISKAETLPNLSFSTEPLHKSIVISEGSSDEYEPVENFTTLTATIDTPPPLPPNHPRRKPKLLPKPPKSSSASNLVSQVISSHVSQEPEILKPVMLLESKALCRPFSNETVYPHGVCYSKNNTLIISDVGNDCLRLIDDSGNFIEKIGRSGRSGGQFKEPSAVTVDNNNYILVCERDNQRVQKFTSLGKYVTKFGQKTLISSLLSDPMGIAVSSDGNVAVSDWDKSQIVFFTQNGKHISSGNKEKYRDNLKFPAGIAFAANGNLLIVDRGNHCIWSLTECGEIVNKIGSHGSKPGELHFPYGVTTRKDGCIIVTESGNNRVSIFTEDGKFIRSFGMPGSKPGMFNHPRHVCINSQGYIVVADEMNHRIQIFSI